MDWNDLVDLDLEDLREFEMYEVACGTGLCSHCDPLFNGDNTLGKNGNAVSP